MTPLDDRAIAEYTAFATHLAELAGHAILPYFRARIDVENKAAAGAFDPVTAADRAAERAIRDEIGRVHPGHGIHGEEFGVAAGKDGLTWLIDPIDGTRAFIIGQLHWGVLIALSDGERPVVGVMHQPYTGETFIGSRLGAEMRRAGVTSILRVRECERLEDAIVASTDPAMFIGTAENEAFHALVAKARMRRYGGDCYLYCLLAAGFVDLVIESGLKAYDIQPLMPIIEAAGGVVTNWAGAAPYEGGQIVAAGDRRLHAIALKMLKPAAK
ncbi:MAG TPA: histidinol-phosphatase [Candidatus Binataceae bacterium]|nr:histidinol-phosphatase [Candidatus Binataceae bacterium]